MRRVLVCITTGSKRTPSRLVEDSVILCCSTQTVLTARARLALTDLRIRSFYCESVDNSPKFAYSSYGAGRLYGCQGIGPWYPSNFPASFYWDLQFTGRQSILSADAEFCSLAREPTTVTPWVDPFSASPLCPISLRLLPPGRLAFFGGIGYTVIESVSELPLRQWSPESSEFTDAFSLVYFCIDYFSGIKFFIHRKPSISPAVLTGVTSVCKSPPGACAFFFCARTFSRQMSSNRQITARVE